MKLDNEEVYKKLIKCFVVKAHILYRNNLAQLPLKKNQFYDTLIKPKHDISDLIEDTTS